MPAPVRLFIISNKVNGTCKGAAHITPIFYPPHVFVIGPLAAIEQLYYSLCALASGLAGQGDRKGAPLPYLPEMSAGLVLPLRSPLPLLYFAI